MFRSNLGNLFQLLCRRNSDRAVLPPLARYRLSRSEVGQRPLRPGRAYQDRRFRNVQRGHHGRQNNQDLLRHTGLYRAGDHIVPAVREVRGLVGLRGAVIRDAGRPAAFRWGRRGGAVRGHHGQQRLLPQDLEQGKGNFNGA